VEVEEDIFLLREFFENVLSELRTGLIPMRSIISFDTFGIAQSL
jgi:hypothetical protein